MKFILLIPWMLSVALFAFICKEWTHLPDRMAVHFGVGGDPNGFGDKLFSCGLLLGILYLALAVCSRAAYKGIADTGETSDLGVVGINVSIMMAVLGGIAYVILKNLSYQLSSAWEVISMLVLLLPLLLVGARALGSHTFRKE